MKEISNCSELIANFDDLKSGQATKLNKKILNYTASVVSNSLSKSKIIQDELKSIQKHNELQDKTINNLQMILEKKRNEKIKNEKRLQALREDNLNNDRSKAISYEKEIVKSARLLGEEE